jgi:pilus assembly protein CpaF
MINLVVRVKDPSGGPSVDREFDGRAVLIGRSAESDLRLNDTKVSKHHAELSVANNKVYIMDLGSRTGTFMNGERVERRSAVSPRDRIKIGDFHLRVATRAPRAAGEPRSGSRRERARSASARAAKAPDPEREGSRRSAASSRRRGRPSLDPFERLGDDDAAPAAPQTLPPTPDAPRPERVSELLASAQLLTPSEPPEPSLEAEQSTPAEPAEPAAPSMWDPDSEYGYLLEFLEPIREFLLDADVSEIMINGPQQVYIEKGGRLHLTEARFPSDMGLVSVCQQIAKSVGRTVDVNNPVLDARLPDGSRFNAVIAPAARRGTTVAIRKFFSEKLTLEKLLEFGALSPPAAEFIEACVRGALNIIVTGGTGSGKTTLLNVVSDCIPGSERIVVIEDASELQLAQTHLVPMETRQADPRTGLGQVTIRDLLRASLRLRPDRIVIGELRGEEAFDLLQAFNTGHRGSMTTVHSNSPRDCLSRIEMLVTLAGLDIPLRAIREQISSAVDMVIYTTRFHDGSRKITHVSEILHLDDQGRYQVSDVFRFRRDAGAPGGKVTGTLDATGYVPICLEHLAMHDVELRPDLFTGPGPA